MRVARVVQDSAVLVFYAAVIFFDPVDRPRPRLRRRRPFFGFETTTAFFFCTAFSATAFGGRPGPPRRHLPGPLRRRRRRFFAFVFPVEMLPSNDWIADRTSRCTTSRITASKLFCVGIDSSLPAPDTRKRDHQQSRRLSDRSGRGGRRPERR